MNAQATSDQETRPLSLVLGSHQEELEGYFFLREVPFISTLGHSGITMAQEHHHRRQQRKKPTRSRNKNRRKASLISYQSTNSFSLLPNLKTPRSGILVQRLLDEYADIFPQKPPAELPQERNVDHRIPLTPGNFPTSQVHPSHVSNQT
jgi:hypothetical protein